MIPIAICADDYAISPGVSAAIRELAGEGRISATSAMTASRFWPEEGPRLAPFAARIDLGLHFALTDQLALAPLPGLAPARRLPSLLRLVFAAYVGRLSASEVAAEFDRQVDAFAAAIGRLPDFVDGHQHVHHLPVIRDVVVARMRVRTPGAWLRVCDEPFGAIVRRGVAVNRAMAISLLAQGLRRRAAEAGIPVNSRFSGVRNPGRQTPFREMFRAYLSELAPHGLVMCHPGYGDAELASVDPLVSERDDELAYLIGDQFPGDLAAADCTLVRLSAVLQ